MTGTSHLLAGVAGSVAPAVLTLMTFHTRTQTQAKHLRLEVAALGAPAPLSSDQSLNLVARINGFRDWNDQLTTEQSRYFHNRHAPYLPNSTALVRALSIRKAALEDLADLEARVTVQVSVPSGQWVIAVAIERALRQARQILQGGATVASELLQTLTSGVTQHPLELEQAVAHAELAYSRSAVADPVQNRHAGIYQSFVATDDARAKAYSNAYTRWRLATLAASLCAICERQDQPAFAALLTEGTDIFASVGALLTEGSSKKLEREQAYPARLLGQAVLLSVQTNGSMEPSLRVPAAVTLPDADALCAKLLARFPEIAFWHAWAELKPLLAPGVDDSIT